MEAQVIREEKFKQPSGGIKTLQILQMPYGGFEVKMFENPDNPFQISFVSQKEATAQACFEMLKKRFGLKNKQ